MKGLKEFVGLADVCELASAAFAFPSEDLASALADGSFSEDLVACLEDAGASSVPDEGLLDRIAGLGAQGADALFQNLRKGHSRLFLVPGDAVPVWPYESPFLFSIRNPEDHTTLFRSPRQIDVERQMREAGVLPKNVRSEPCDSVWDELSFMSYLYGNAAKSLYEGNEAEASEWHGRALRFWDEHPACWMLDFMDKTASEAPKYAHGAEYAVLAEVGRLVLEEVGS